MKKDKVSVKGNKVDFEKCEIAMERKIGEIFEFGGEWYQCLKSARCYECVFKDKNCDNIRNLRGYCIAPCRSDRTDVHFKKLEKVGEPYMNDEKIVQKYKIYYDPLIAKNGVVERYVPGLVDIVIKQNKEDTEEKKLNLKPFDLEAAKQGHPVCCRNGRKARIICFDANVEKGKPIVALLYDGKDREFVRHYTEEGKDYENCSFNDLMMLPEKKEGWVNVYKDSVCISVYPRIYKSRDEAVSDNTAANRIDTVKVCWEE